MSKRNHPNNPWADTRTEQLKLRWAQGLSASQIAAEINGGSFVFTRNAVIGKVHRLGLQRGTRITRRYNSEPVAKPPKIKRPRAQNGGTWFNPSTTPELVAQRQADAVAFVDEFDSGQAQDAASIPLEQRKQLVDLENHHCRWPFGFPGREGFFFCGAEEANMAAGRPYCRCHAALAFSGKPMPRLRAWSENKSPRAAA